MCNILKIKLLINDFLWLRSCTVFGDETKIETCFQINSSLSNNEGNNQILQSQINSKLE